MKVHSDPGFAALIKLVPTDAQIDGYFGCRPLARIKQPHRFALELCRESLTFDHLTPPGDCPRSKVSVKPGPSHSDPGFRNLIAFVLIRVRIAHVNSHLPVKLYSLPRLSLFTVRERALQS